MALNIFGSLTKDNDQSLASKTTQPQSSIAVKGQEIDLNPDSNEVTVRKTKKKHVDLIPYNDTSKAMVGKIAFRNFVASNMEIMDIDKSTLLQTLTDFENAKELGANAGAEGKYVNYQKKVQHAKIDGACSKFKKYFEDDYSRTEMYKVLSQYAIEKQNTGVYEFPHDMEHRLEAMGRFLKKLDNSPYNNRKYGYEFWLNTYNDYSLLVEKSRELKNIQTDKVDVKGELRKVVNDALRAIRDAIRLHYRKRNPDAILRQWGYDPRTY